MPAPIEVGKVGEVLEKLTGIVCPLLSEEYPEFADTILPLDGVGQVLDDEGAEAILTPVGTKQNMTFPLL